MFGNAFNLTRGNARCIVIGRLVAAAVLAVGVLAACGGSDSGSAPSAAPPAAVAPIITAQPAALTVTEGDGAAFTVSASGSAPLAYQWKRGGVDIAGATASTYTLTATTLSDDGAAFTVTVSNSAGSVTSSPARLTVSPRVIAPAITVQPSSVAVAEGATVSLSVTATGTNLAYQWQRNDIDIPGATGPTYTFTATAADNGARFAVVVSNAAGRAASNAAVLTVSRSDSLTVGTAGGTIRVGSDDVIIDVPAGALTGDTTFTVTRAAAFGDIDPDFPLIPGTLWDVAATGGGLADGQTLRVSIRMDAGAVPAPVRAQSRVHALASGDPAGDFVSVVRCPDDSVKSYLDDYTWAAGYGRAVYMCESGNRINARLGIAVRRPVAPSAVEFDRALNGSAIDTAVVEGSGQMTVTYRSASNSDDQRLARYNAAGLRTSDMAVPGLSGSRLTVLDVNGSGQIAAVHARRVSSGGGSTLQPQLVVYRTAPAGLIGNVTGLTQTYQAVLSYAIDPLNRIRPLALAPGGALIVAGRTEDLTADGSGGAPWGGLRGCFIARINADGTLAWARPLTPPGSATSNLMCDRLRAAPGALAVDAAGASYLAGEDVLNDAGSANCTFATGAGCPAVYKFDANGNPVWRRVLSINPSSAALDSPSARVAIDAQGNVLASALAGNVATVARLASADGAIAAGATLDGAPTTTSNGRAAPRLSMDGAGNVYAGIAHLLYRFAPDFANGIALNLAAGTGVLETQVFAIGADTAGSAYGTVESGEFTSNADLRLRKLRYP
jgi:hypothetical protein